MTTYGTIPSTPQAPSNLEFISRAKEQIWVGLDARRPWKDMVQLDAISFPTSFNESIERIKTNAVFFRINYLIIVLFILFLSLLWNPISLVVFTIMMVAWLFLYFLRDQSLVVFGRRIDDRIVMMVLLLGTVAALFLTNVSDSIIIGLTIGAVVVLVHGALRDTSDSFVDYEGHKSGARLGGGESKNMPLKHAASSSYSLS